MAAALAAALKPLLVGALVSANIKTQASQLIGGCAPESGQTEPKYFKYCDLASILIENRPRGLKLFILLNLHKHTHIHKHTQIHTHTYIHNC